MPVPQSDKLPLASVSGVAQPIVEAAVQVPSPENVLFQQLLDAFNKQYTAGQQVVKIEVLTVGTTATVLYRTTKFVRGGTIQNLSTTDTVTLIGNGEQNRGKAATGATAGTGFVLNAAAGAGQGGGTWNFGNIDLSTITAITSTNATQKVCVVYYI